MSSVEPVRRLPNFSDLNDRSLKRRDTAAGVLARLLGLRGYERIETPMVEQAELFVRKSGGELSSRLYGFVEPGGYRVGLRPEFTAPVLRYAIDTASEGGWPRRYQYSGPVFRYASPEDEDAQKSRQFTQVGAEIIGSGSSMADGEVIAASLEGLAALGVPAPIAVIGHVGILWDVLRPLGLSDRARLFLVNSVGRLREGGDAVDAVRSDAERLGLTGAANEEKAPTKIPAGSSLADVAAVIEATIGPTDANAGVRSREEIVERLAKKQTTSSDPHSFEKAFDLIARLAKVKGPVNDALKQGEQVVGDQRAMDPLRQLIEACEVQGVSKNSLSVDLGLARGIAYYTGMIFDLHARQTSGESLGGGGRYDGLTKALGAESDLPALGFAYTLESVIEAMESSGEDTVESDAVLVRPSDDSAAHAAVTKAAELRREDARAVLDFERRSPDESMAFARWVGASSVVTVESDGATRQEAVK